MKKVLLILVSLSVLLALTACGTTGGGSAGGAVVTAETGNLGEFRLRMEDNFEWGTSYQGLIRDRKLLGGHQLKPGDTFILRVTYSPSRDMEAGIEVAFVDTTEAANWWTFLSWDPNGGDDLPELPQAKAGEVVSAELTLTILTGATTALPSANTLCLQTNGEGVQGRPGSGVQKPFNLNFTQFELIKQ